MSRLFPLLGYLSLSLALATPVLADTPNLAPGLWAYTNVTSISGPVSVSPQTTNNQECLKQKDLDKGVDMLNIPQSCTITQADIHRDNTQFAAVCNMSGMKSLYQGHANFHGDHLDGMMNSETDTPLGKMLMNMEFTAKRVGDC